jgi:hypothetical protein
MDRTLFFGVVAGLGAAAGLAGWALGWPGPALVAVAAVWARMQFRMGEVARQTGDGAAERPDAVTAGLTWGAVLAAGVVVLFLVLAR